MCSLAVLAGAVFYQLDAAHAVTPEQQQACTPDAMRLCQEFIPDVARVTACMRAKRAQLSPACRAAMSGGARGVHRYRRHASEHCRYHRHCG